MIAPNNPDISNIRTLLDEFIWKDAVGLETRMLGAAAGSRRLYVNIDTVPPNAYSTKYHSHSRQEEFFLILEGSGTLRINNAEHPVSKGDFIAKPAGQNIAHTFYNSGTEPLVILDAGSVEEEDTVYYPDEGVSLHKANGQSQAFRGGKIVEGWSSYPNE